MALARWERTIVDDAGDILPGASVTVREEAPGAPLAVLYSDRAGTTPIGNPFTADAVTARAAFHVVGGPYRIDVSQGAFSATLRYVGIGTAQEADTDTFLVVNNEGDLTTPIRSFDMDESGFAPNHPPANTARVFALAREGQTELRYRDGASGDWRLLAFDPEATPYDADPSSGFFANFDMQASLVLALAQAEEQPLSEDGGWRSIWALWHTDSDEYDYEAESPQYRTISDVLHIGVFGSNDGSGNYELQYKDLHGLTAHAIGRIGWDERGVAGIAADSVQYGEGVSLIEFGVYNPALANEQSKHLAGVLAVVSGKKAAADATHFVRGMEVINVGKLATAGFEAFSSGTDGDNGRFDYLLKGNNMEAAQGGILMPLSAAGDVGTYIIYDVGDFSSFERSSSTYRWTLGASAVLALDASGLFPPGTASLGLAAFPWTNGYFASGAFLDFGNNDVRLTHSSNLLTLSGGAFVAPWQGLQVGSGYVREVLAGARTYYVRTDGSDSNTGLVDSAGGAFLTLQKAWDTIAENLDLNGNVVTVQVGDGTYTAGVSATAPVVGMGMVIFLGDVATPGDVLVSVTGGNCFSSLYESRFRVRGMEMRTTTSGNCLVATFGGQIYFDSVIFGDCAGSHMEAYAAGIIYGDDDYTINGDALQHLHAYSLGWINLFSLTATVSGTPAFSNFFAGAAIANINCAGVTFSGAATGVRYLSHKNAQIETNGGGASFFPGNSAGSTASGGLYDSDGADLIPGDFVWTGYTPTITAGSGTFTSVSATGAYCTIGKVTFFTITVTITTNGTAAGYVQATLPNTVATLATVAGREDAATGAMVQAKLTNGTATARIFKYDNNYPGVDGAIITISGQYENT
jgi:hypothetical protein